MNTGIPQTSVPHNHVTMFVAVVTWLMLNTEHQTMANACWTLEREVIASALGREHAFTGSS